MEKLRHVRVFGSQAYVHVPDNKRKKLDSKDRKLIFVGYAMEQKAYRFVDSETDARFLEMNNGSSSIGLDPFVEENEEVRRNSAEAEELGESSNSYVPLRRSKRLNIGTRLRRLDDYNLEFAVGIAAYDAEATSSDISKRGTLSAARLNGLSQLSSKNNEVG